MTYLYKVSFIVLSFLQLAQAAELPSIPTKEDHMKAAIQVAKAARDHGNHPFGAVLVYNNQIILTAENKVVTSKDCTAHAELELVRKTGELDKEIKSKSTLYASTEPCAMCTGAIVWSGIRHVVYGSPTQILAKYSNGSFMVPCRDLLSKSTKEIMVEGPFLEDEAEKVHIGFWTKG